MRPARWGAGLAAGAVFLTVLTGVGAAAQLTDPVDVARQERDEARSVLNEAEATLDGAAGGHARAEDRLGLVSADLNAAVIRYRSVNGELEAVTFRLAELRNEIVDREGEVRELRRTTREYVTDAYMAGGIDGLSTFFAVDNYSDLVTGRAVLAEATARSAGLAADLAAGRQRLDGLHVDHDEEQERLRVLREESHGLVLALDGLFQQAGNQAGEAAEALDAARAAVADADARYQAATRRLDEEIARQRLISPGVEKWRPLVQRYFPPHRVAEAMSVMQCESSGIATATHPASGAAGLFQFMPGTWVFASAEAGFAGSSPYDPEANIASAAWLVDFSVRTGHPRGPWGRWTCQPYG